MRFGLHTSLILLFMLAFSPAFAQSGAPQLRLAFEHDKVFIINEEQLAITADLYLGTAQQPVEDIYALSLDIAFPHELIVPDSVSFIYHSESFFGDEHEVDILKPSQPDKGRMGITLGRRDGKNVSGFGKIGTYRFITSSDIIGGRAGDDGEILFDLDMFRFEARDAEGNTVPFEANEEGSSVTLILDRLAQNFRFNDRRVDVYPNPADDVLYVAMQNLRAEKIEVFNAVGQRVLMEPVRTNILQLATSHYQPGVYFLKIHAEEGVVTRRVVIRR